MGFKEPSRMQLYRMVMHLRKTKGYGWRKISKILQIPPATVGSWLYRGCKPWREPKLFPSKALSYILGVLLGDGCVTVFWNKSIKCFNHRIVLNTIDKEFADAFSKALRKIGLNPRIDYIKRESHWMVSCENKKFATWYKSLKLDDIQKIVKPHTPDFVRGFYDSEGSCVKHYDGYIYVGMYNSNRKILEAVQMFLTNFGFKTKITKRPPLKLPHKIKGRLVKTVKDSFVLSLLGGRPSAIRLLTRIKPSIQRKAL